MVRRLRVLDAASRAEREWRTLKRPVIALLIVLFMWLSPSAASAATPLAEWGTFTSHLEAATSADDPNNAVTEIDQARALLEIVFVAAAPEARGEGRQIERTLAAARLAAASGDSESLLIETELARTRTFSLVSEAFITAVESDRPKQADAWLAIIAEELDLGPNDNLVRTMGSYQAGNEEARQDLVPGLMAHLVSRVTDHTDQALAAADPDSLEANGVRARIETAAGIGYFHAARSMVEEELGIEESARVLGLLHKLRDAVTDRDFSAATQAGEAVKYELSSIGLVTEIAGPALVKEITQITAILTDASRQADARQLNSATDLTEKAWVAFTKIEPQIRRHDTVRYISIEKHFTALRSGADAPRLRELRTLFLETAEVISGTMDAADASLTERLFTGFERIQPLLFAFLALLATYPLYLVAKAFSWRQRAWRNISLFIMIAAVPVFMEAIGRLGVELGVESLQAFSFTANEYAKMVWAFLVLAGLLFAIAGLRELNAEPDVPVLGVKPPKRKP